MCGQFKAKEEVNSIVKRYFIVSSSPYLSPDQEGRFVACLVLMRTEAHREDTGSASHFKADEHELGMLLLKFQSGGTAGGDSILGYSPKEQSGGQKSVLDCSFHTSSWDRGSPILIIGWGPHSHFFHI